MPYTLITARPGVPHEVADAEAERAELADRVRWLVRMRWAASLVLACAVGVGVLSSVVDPTAALLGAPVVLALANGAYWLALRSSWAVAVRTRLAWFAVVQIVGDMVCLSVVLQRTGGADNPMEVLLVLPAAVAGMSLRMRTAIAVSLGGLGVHAGLMVAEFKAWIAHAPLALGSHASRDLADPDPLWQSPAYVAGHLLAMLVVVVAVVYFVGTLVARMRGSEGKRREHERIAASRARLARIGSLSAGVAHSIRNPLHGLGNCVDLLRAKALPRADAEELEVVSLMDEGVRRIEKITQRLLVLGDDGPVHVAPTELQAVVREAIGFLDPTGKRKVEIVTEYAPTPPVSVDSDRVAEALANILDNAIDASASGGAVRVRVGPGSDRASALVEVVDEGEGMSADVAARVFDAFFTTKPMGDGTGLGLSIARRVVEAHGGTIAIRSELGTGTSVCIELPIDLPATAQDHTS